MSSFKAFERRNKTLLVEYKNQFKSNSFVDKRLGENDPNLTLEDKIFKRFVVERQKNKEKKSSKFNLNDDDDNDGEDDEIKAAKNIELTHMGQSLSQIEKFEKVAMSDDEDDENDESNGRINAKMVSENFFGGFTETTEEDKKKNRKQWVDEMIAKSKQAKYERQKERDKTLDLTEELDKEWKNIMPLISVMVNKSKQEQDKQELLNNKKTSKKPDDYDVLVRSLQFDSKAQPTDKLKTEAELEKERLEEIKRKEKELEDRMSKEVEIEDENESANKSTKHGNNNYNKNLKKIPSNHRSADDMDFNDPEYLQLENQNEIKKRRAQEDLNEEKKVKEEKSDDDDDEEEDEESGKEEEDEDTDADNASQSEEVDEDEEEDEDNDDDEEDEEEEDTEEIEKPKETKDKKPTKGPEEFDNEKWIDQFEKICFKLDNKTIDLKQFDSSIRSIINKLDPSKDENNKKRLAVLAQHLVEYYQSLFTLKSANNSINLNLVKLCTSFIFELISKYGGKSTRQEPSVYLTYFKKILTNINTDYTSIKLNERKFPQLNILFTFKLIATLFPTSDFRHQVTTPCLLIMNRYLTECSVKTVGECFRGSFLTNLCYEFVKKSKRYIPECIQYLNGVLYLAIDWRSNKKLNTYDLSTIYESFRRTKLNLIVSEKIEKLNEISLSHMSQIELENVNESTKASLIAYNIDLLNAFSQIYQDILCFKEIFALTKCLLNLLPAQNYPDDLKKRLKSLEEFIEDKSDKPREHLQCLNKKPLASTQFEPKIQAKTKFDPRHHNTVISEKQLLTRKYKKELKSAVKEIRQDNHFLARVRLNEQMEKDAKRSKKVKEIMSSLSTQEGEFQKAKRMKS